MNEQENAMYISTYNPDYVQVHSDTSDFDIEDNPNVKTKKVFIRKARKHKQVHLVIHKSQGSHSSLYYDMMDCVQSENRKNTKLKRPEVDYDYLNFRKETNLKNLRECTVGKSIDDSGRSRNKRIDKHIRCESKSAKKCFIYDTNNIDPKSCIVKQLTNKTLNKNSSCGKYHTNSQNKRVYHDGKKQIRPGIYYRIDGNCIDNNNRTKRKRIDRYVNSEGTQIENHCPSDRKLIKNRIYRQDKPADCYIQSGDNRIHKALHSTSSRWPLLKQKCMPHLYNILGRFGSNTVAQKNTRGKCKRRKPLEDVDLFYCSKCKTTRTTNNSIHVVQAIHSSNENTYNRTVLDQMKYVQHGVARVLQAEDIDKSPLQRKRSNCSFSFTSDSEMMNDKSRQKFEKQLKKKIKKYLNRQIKKGSVKEKLQPYPREDVTYASMDIKNSLCSTSSYFLDSLFRDINKKYEDKQTNSIRTCNRKKRNVKTLDTRVGGSDYIYGRVGHFSNNYPLSDSNFQRDCYADRGTNNQQQIKTLARVNPIMGFRYHCLPRHNECILNSQILQPTQTPRTLPMNNPSAPIRPIPQKSLGNFVLNCGCKKELNHKNQLGNYVNYRPFQCHPYPPPQRLPYPPPQRLPYPPPQHPQPLQPPPRYPRPPPLSPAVQIKQEKQECSEGCNRYSHDKILEAVKKQYNGEIICIHKPPCVLINGCLNLPPNEISKLQSTAVYSTVQPTKIPLTHSKAVNPGSRNNMKISNICKKRVENKTPYLPRGQISNNVRRTTHGINTGKPYYETSKYQSELKDNPKIMLKTLQIQSIQVETSTNEMETEDGTKIKSDEADITKNVKSTESKSDMLDIPKNVNHPTTPLGDLNTTTTQVRHGHSMSCHNNCGAHCLCKSNCTSSHLSQGLNLEHPICLMNYSDFPVIKENASAQVTPEADPKFENYCIHVPICQKLRNCHVEMEKKYETPTTQSYKTQTSNMNLISLIAKEAVSVNTSRHDSMKSFNIYEPVKKMSKCVSNNSLRKIFQQKETSMIPETEKHCIALTAVNEISTQVLYRRCISNFRHHTESDVLTRRDITGRQAQDKQRKLICRHNPPCILVHKCIGTQLKDSIIAYEDIPECSHKHCCELIPACLARNLKNVRTVSSQYPPNTCQIV